MGRTSFGARITLLPLVLASVLLAGMPSMARAVEARLTDDAYTASNGALSNFGSATFARSPSGGRWDGGAARVREI